MVDLFNLEAKKYIIFGASSGIGRQTAVQLSQLGANLVLIGRDEKTLNETHSMLKGKQHTVLCCDIANFDSATNIVKAAVSEDGKKLDGCVFSAGIYGRYPTSIVKEEKALEFLKTNFLSFVAIIKAFSSKRISNDGASFVSVSSRAGSLPDKSQGIYGATKAAINSYTIVAAKEMSNRFIRFNAVCPEAVNTPMGRELKENMPEQLMKKTYPLGMLEAEDVANAIIFLLSDMSKKITGQSIWLSAGNDGGSIEGHVF